ncbi:MAG: hypothetical protein Q7T44_11005 [Parvibaculum sp.]|nr:hypothetical protein [Parvibaculum sp.]
MAFFLKLTASVFLSVVLGLGSAYVALYSTGKADAASSNPYERAAYAVRDLLPGGRSAL